MEVNNKVSKFRMYLPQILASTAKNLLILDIGLAVAFPTIAIPPLLGTVEGQEDEVFHFTAEEASWFGSLAFICTPIGSILSGWVTEPIGRKNAMIIVNLPHIAAWLLLHFATSVPQMYLSAILLGLGTGFMEAPVVTYVGEICQPSIRGILTSCAGVAATLGFFLGYLLGTIVTWREVALICLTIPVFTVIAICFVPETPLWLLSRGREKQARKSLQWLRGWVKPEVVEKEFLELQRYSTNSNRCNPCQKSDQTCTHPPPTLIEKMKELIRKRSLKPMFIVTMFFFFCQFSGMSGMRPYLVQIFQAYGAPVNPNWATVVTGLLKFLANIVCTVGVKFIGKRLISLVSIAGTAICCIAIGFYANIVLPPGWSSFDKHTNVPGDGTFPMVMFFALSFITSVGMIPVPWMLLSEVFPFKSRATSAGIVAALCYIMIFISTKTYLNLERSLGLDGTIWFYGIVAVLGFLFFYFFLPETENRSLEDIEIHFSTQKLTNIDIKKKSSEDSNVVEKKTDPSVENGLSGCDNKAYTDKY
ncbi:facilitated trehalose transporter Tret1-like [Phlebotomus papatasi]|uniref:facilitated trehalose transporter Tret1-like n=1 Tax=Phlebotomus papatasi TaxID=29031 RepID=UPI002483AB70|nr:facilitated trehalose transporter Tret1-like [Phlebotomus papatasi]XP_055716572.1 facilitated trehalose transporter Tret1-like [Phlebotomus papatasi]